MSAVSSEQTDFDERLAADLEALTRPWRWLPEADLNALFAAQSDAHSRINRLHHTIRDLEKPSRALIETMEDAILAVKFHADSNIVGMHRALCERREGITPPNAPALVRIDGREGYVPGNVMIVPNVRKRSSNISAT